MEIEAAIELLRKIVKNNSTNDTRHMDLTLVPVEERDRYEKALKIVKIAIIEGKLTQEDFSARIHLN